MILYGWTACMSAKTIFESLARKNLTQVYIKNYLLGYNLLSQNIIIVWNILQLDQEERASYEIIMLIF